MKTKCMSCGGTTKKMQAGGTTKKMQAGGLPKAQDGRSVIYKFQNSKPLQQVQRVKKEGPIKAIKKVIKVVKKITKPTTPKMELGGSLETFRNGGGKKGRGWKIGMDPLLHEKQRCNYKKKKKLSQLNARDKAVRILKGVGKTVLGAGAAIGAGAIAYKKSPRFKNAVDQFKTDVKDKLGLQKGGVVKKYQDGGPIDSLKVIKKKGKLAVKTEKQKQAAAKKAAANAKKIAKAKENARLNLEWQKMTKDQKDSLFINERQKNW
jgi:hypothetical protein